MQLFDLLRRWCFMPFQPSPGGGTYNPEAPTVGVFTIDQTAASNVTALSTQPRTVQAAAEEAQVQIKLLPQPIRTPADLPSNATPGTWFVSKANPSAIYTLGYDGVWRGLTLLPLA